MDDKIVLFKGYYRAKYPEYDTKKCHKNLEERIIYICKEIPVSFKFEHVIDRKNSRRYKILMITENKYTLIFDDYDFNFTNDVKSLCICGCELRYNYLLKINNYKFIIGSTCFKRFFTGSKCPIIKNCLEKNKKLFKKQIEEFEKIKPLTVEQLKKKKRDFISFLFKNLIDFKLKLKSFKKDYKEFQFCSNENCVNISPKNPNRPECLTCYCGKSFTNEMMIKYDCDFRKKVKKFNKIYKKN